MRSLLESRVGVTPRCELKGGRESQRSEEGDNLPMRSLRCVR